jgi:hypothetical protein
MTASAIERIGLLFDEMKIPPRRRVSILRFAISDALALAKGQPDLFKPPEWIERDPWRNPNGTIRYAGYDGGSV